MRICRFVEIMRTVPARPMRRRWSVGLLLALSGLCAGGRAAPAEAQGTNAQLTPAVGKSDSVSVVGGVIHFTTAGHGLAVVLLSGGPGYAGTFLEPVYVHLAARSRAVLLDQRGTGRSSSFTDSTFFSLANAVGDIESVRIRLGVDQIVLLGHSWGGALAMAYTAAHPTRVAGLVLVGSASLLPKATNAAMSQRLRARLRPADIDSIRLLSALVPDPAQHAAAIRRIHLLNWKAYEYDPANVSALAARLTPASYNEQTARWMYADLVRTGSAVDRQLDSALVLHRVPVLIAYGDVDPVGATTVTVLQGHFPGARIAILPRSGHHPWIEAPSELYAAIDSFLRSIK
jgi:proline iminopeptidase